MSRSGKRSPSRERTSTRSGGCDLARLTDVLSGIVNAGSRRLNNSHSLNEKFLPEFDPAGKTLTASDWIDKINDCGQVYDWDGKVKLYLAGCRLRGNAKLWYDGLTQSFLNWDVFSHALIKQFPGNESFSRLFHDVVAYKSKPGQDLQEYCFNKLRKINRLKLDVTESQIVDLIAHDIHDETVRTAILTTKLGTIAELNQRLSIFPTVKNKDLKESKNADATRDVKQSNFQRANDRDLLKNK